MGPRYGGVINGHLVGLVIRRAIDLVHAALEGTFSEALHPFAVGLDGSDVRERFALPGERSPVRDVLPASLPTLQRFASVEELGRGFKC